MRNEDLSKVDTVGAYCNLLYSNDAPELTLYHGCTLTNEMIEDHKRTVGKQIDWLSFTSTSKSRQQADQFENTLFIIHLSGDGYYSGHQKGISSLSNYPQEEELLLQPGVPLYLDKVDYNDNY
ncbi:unnamed protein product [Didymodactylos carnosus]|uniref:NAD(P)(+)--arginine ADP-ribosyltransferase n=1 Tax=Didymodactylos carnosus TaxID=1234261 RepID=A0A8S2Y8E7_9BILA|nr:unnamed protein product [Didymodactylos carnosus]CAF4531231.1 unnamed protein product [Didymodactylos carnosus]